MKLQNLENHNLVNFLNKHQDQIVKMNDNAINRKLVNLSQTSTNAEIKACVGQLLQLPSSNLCLGKTLPFMAISSSKLLKKSLIQVIIFLFLFSGVNSTETSQDEKPKVFFEDTSNYFKISSYVYQKETFMIKDIYSLKNFSSFENKLQNLKKKIDIFYQFSQNNAFCYDYMENIFQNDISDLSEIWNKSLNSLSSLQSLNHIENNVNRKNFVSYANKSQCWYTFGFHKLSEIKSFQLDTNLLKMDTNMTYLEHNLFSINKLSRYTKCINYGKVLTSDHFLKGVHTPISKLAGCIRHCLSTKLCRVYTFDFKSNHCYLYKQGVKITVGKLKGDMSIFGKAECRLNYDIFEPQIKFEGKLNPLSFHCNFTERYNNILYNCPNFYRSLLKPIENVQLHSTKFLQFLHQNLDFTTQKQKRSLQMLFKASKIILPLINTEKISQVLNIKSMLGTFMNADLTNIKDWFLKLGIKSSFSQENNFFSVNLFSDLKEDFILEPFNYQLFSFFEDLKNIQKSVYEEIERVSSLVNFGNSTKKNLPQNFIYSRYIQNDFLKTISIYQNFSRSVSKSVLLIPKGKIHDLSQWSLGKLNNNFSESKCLIQAFKGQLEKNCQKPQNIKLLQMNIFHVSLDLEKFKLSILIINKNSVVQIGCSNFNKIYSISQLHIFALDESCNVYVDNVLILKSRSVENFLLPELLFWGKFISKLDTFSNITEIMRSKGFQNNITDSVLSKLSQQFLIPGIQMNTNDFTQYCVIGFMILGYVAKWVYQSYSQQISKEKGKITEIDEVNLETVPLMSLGQNKTISSKPKNEQ